MISQMIVLLALAAEAPTVTKDFVWVELPTGQKTVVVVVNGWLPHITYQLDNWGNVRSLDCRYQQGYSFKSRKGQGVVSYVWDGTGFNNYGGNTKPKPVDATITKPSNITPTHPRPKPGPAAPKHPDDLFGKYGSVMKRLDDIENRMESESGGLTRPSEIEPPEKPVIPTYK